MQQIKYWIKKKFGSIIFHHLISDIKKKKILRWIDYINSVPLNKLSDSSFNIFTYHGEDGILLYILKHMKNVPTIFADIGSGDCIKSNCSMLAYHFGWQGVFIDKNKNQLEIGKSFYKRKIKKGLNIKFVNAEVTSENIADIMKINFMDSEIGLLSIDIDGNDYWIWKAIDKIRPRIVVIEAKVEFGYRDIIVPDSYQNHFSYNKRYNGASVKALKKLGEKKGYKLIGANKQGYNLFFVRKEENLETENIEMILSETDTLNSFYPDSFFPGYKFITE